MHISDHDLRAVLADADTDSTLEQIESHIEQCSACRKRLQLRAADPTWRQKINSVLSDSAYQQVAKDLETIGLDILPGSNPAGLDQRDESLVLKEIQDILQPPGHPEMLGRVGRYDVQRIIGRGGMGIVVKAFDVELNRPVAIKIMSPMMATHGTARQRFAREARAAAAVLHPNVIPIHGVDTCSEVPYLVMPYVAGESLQTLVDSRGPLNEKDIVRIVKQIASGLAAAHAQGLVHRDIKPANILIDNDVNRVLITDFGLARAEDDVSMTRTGWIAGTPNYMSPEQSCGQSVDSRSDLFSLGSLTYFLATGRMPFPSDSPMGVLHRIKNEQPVPVRQVNEEISPTLSDIVERSMEKNPADRFASAAEVELILEQYLAVLHQPMARHRMPKIILPTKQRRRRATRMVAACTGLGMVATLFVVIGLSQIWLASSTKATPTNTITTASSEQDSGQNSALSWDSIADKYELVDENKFRDQLDSLTRYSAQIQQAINANETEPSDNRFAIEMRTLETELQSVQDNLGDMSNK